jgi:hypothetical protein
MRLDLLNTLTSLHDIKFVNRPVIIWTLPNVVLVQVKAHLLKMALILSLS